MTNPLTISDATPGKVYALEFDAPEVGGHGATFFADTLLTLTGRTGTDALNGKTIYQAAINGRHAYIPGSIEVTEFHPNN